MNRYLKCGLILAPALILLLSPNHFLNTALAPSLLLVLLVGIGLIFLLARSVIFLSDHFGISKIETRTVLGMGLITLLARLFQLLLESNGGYGYGALAAQLPEPSGWMMLLISVAMLFFIFEMNRTWMAAAIAGAVLLALLTATSPSWSSIALPQAWLIAGTVYAATIAYAALLAGRPVFRSGSLRIRHNSDQLSIKSEYGDEVTMSFGRVLCEQSEQMRSETRTGGGSHLVPRSSQETAYGSDGQMHTVTVHYTERINVPYHRYEISEPTGQIEFKLSETGPDQHLLLARTPANIHIRTRHDASKREKSTTFSCRPWPAFRFGLWRVLHRKAFFHKDRTLSRRITRIASQHVSEMKRRHGRISMYELKLDHELNLVWLVGLRRDKAFAQSANEAATLTIPRQEADLHWKNGLILLPSPGNCIRPATKIKAKMSKWAKVAATRKGKAG